MSSLALKVVALALQRESDGRYLMAQRSPGSSGAGQWEFPGGKIEQGETQEQALIREIHEELSISIKKADLIFIASHIFQYPQRTIQLYLWTTKFHEEPQVQLTEHDQVTWCLPSEMTTLNISEADIYFIDKLL